MFRISLFAALRPADFRQLRPETTSDDCRPSGSVRPLLCRGQVLLCSLLYAFSITFNSFSIIFTLLLYTLYSLFFYKESVRLPLLTIEASIEHGVSLLLGLRPDPAACARGKLELREPLICLI